MTCNADGVELCRVGRWLNAAIRRDRPMEWERIHKRPEDYADANLRDYRQYAAAFSWEEARGAARRPAGRRSQHRLRGDRPAPGAGRGGKLAIRWIGRSANAGLHLRRARRGDEPLRERARTLGVGKGDRVFSLLGRVPELYIAALGTLKNGSVFSPLFSAFGPEPIKARMAIGGRQGPRHDRGLLPPQGRALARRARQPASTCC